MSCGNCEINEELATNSKWNNNPKQQVLTKLILFVESNSQNNAILFLFRNFILFMPQRHYTAIPSSCFSFLFFSLYKFGYISYQIKNYTNRYWDIKKRHWPSNFFLEMSFLNILIWMSPWYIQWNSYFGSWVLSKIF